MKELITLNTLEDKIERVENRSSSEMKRIRFYFKNGYGISIIQGSYSYGGNTGLYEIAPLGLDDELNGHIVCDSDDDYVDDVFGYLSEEDVIKYATIIANKETDKIPTIESLTIDETK